MLTIPANLPQWKQNKYHMVQSWQTLNQTCCKGQTVFTGSSLMEMFPVEKFAAEEGPDFPVVYNRGVGGWRSGDMLLCLNEMVIDLQPRRVFINIGTNDLSDASVTIDALIARYDEILSRIVAAVPGVEIILMAYYPINYEAADEGMKANLRIRTNARICEANAAVEALGARRGYRFINVNAPLMDCEGRLRADYTIEGMHIKEIGYRAIWPLVKAAILA
jgi:lysophospholipase L1-like esterase